MRRFIRYDNLGQVIGEISENDIISMTRREVINGEHSLEVTTVQVLEKNERIVYQDGRGIWREYAVAGVDEEHASGRRIIGTYYCVWSMQTDLSGVVVSAMPGTQTPVNASNALSAALSTQGRWTKGTVANMRLSGASMYDMSAWKALGVLVENWGGELDATIEVSNEGVTARKVDLYTQQGASTAYRRFDFGADLSSIKRIFADEPYYCRISPRGKGTESGDGYGRKIRINDEDPTQQDYLQYDPMVSACILPDGDYYNFPTLIVENSECETPADLLAWGQSVLADYCTPKITYEVNAIQAAAEGVDVHGVSLGDAVHIVDKYFGDDGLRLSGRVTEMTVDELNEQEITVKIGYAAETLSSKVTNGAAAYEIATNIQQSISTAEYIQSLVDRINAEINATGGYTYITEGQGIRTYDAPVSDPLIGAEASSVVEIKGGAIRIANSKTAQGAWEWKTVFTSGHIAADLVTAANITTGYIGNASGGSYWDLDAGELTVSGGTITGGTINGTNIVSSMLESSDHRISIDLTTASAIGGILLSNSTYYARNLYLLISYLGIQLCTVTKDASGHITTFTPYKNIGANIYENGTDPDGMSVGTSNSYASFSYGGEATLEAANYIYIGKNNSPQIQCYGTFSVTGYKSRLVETENYGERLLYCYETPSPMFGDIGSGVIGDDGFCYVEIDDMFSETVRTDYTYQVFLQKCGSGECWVDEKTPTHFVVRGTSGLAFDWEMKARQYDYTSTRLENNALDAELSEEQSYGNDYETIYADEFGIVAELERTLYEAA